MIEHVPRSGRRPARPAVTLAAPTSREVAASAIGRAGRSVDRAPAPRPGLLAAGASLALTFGLAGWLALVPTLRGTALRASPHQADPEVSIELADGRDQVGVIAGQVFTLTARLQARAPGGGSLWMRHRAGNAVCSDFDTLIGETWQAFTATLVVSDYASAGFHPYAAAVQIRDDGGRVSPVACDELTVEGMMPPPDPTPSSTPGPTGVPTPTATAAVTISNARWVEYPSPVSSALRSVTALPSGEAWAVGVEGTVLEHVGDTWRALPPLTTQDLNAVHASSPQNVWVVGDSGVVLHFDGRRWARVDAGTDEDLAGVFAVSASSVWIVGSWEASLHYDGVRMTRYPGPDFSRLRDVLVTPEGAYAIGSRRGRSALFALDPTPPAWSLVFDVQGPRETLLGLAAWGGALWTGGGGCSFEAGPCWSQLWRVEGGRWQSLPPPSGSPVYRIRSAAGRLWVLGCGRGCDTHSSDDGLRWTVHPGPVSSRGANDLAFSDAVGWLVGTRGTIHRLELAEISITPTAGPARPSPTRSPTPSSTPIPPSPDPLEATETLQPAQLPLLER